MPRAWPASSGAPNRHRAVEILLALVVVALVVWFVSVPLRRSAAQSKHASEHLEDPRTAELQARKEAKYREIRDAELDREQGKLSQADWARQDAELRREAIQILKELDAAKAAVGEREATSGPSADR
jgi:flagellar biosynthesis/type III secretory pathway M-ring protein FliF/YscJ